MGSMASRVTPSSPPEPPASSPVAAALGEGEGLPLDPSVVPGVSGVPVTVPALVDVAVGTGVGVGVGYSVVVGVGVDGVLGGRYVGIGVGVPPGGTPVPAL